MKLRFGEQNEELQSPCVVGILPLDPSEALDVTRLKEKAAEIEEYGAAFIEVGMRQPCASEVEQVLLPEAVGAVFEATNCHIAVHTSSPQLMQEAVSRGASLIIDPKALRAEGALAMAASLKVPVCLCFNGSITSEDFGRGKADPASVVSEFLYERIDACLNAGIPRSQLLIDPTPDVEDGIEHRLTAMGRLHTFKSFALPLCVAIPRELPHEDLAVSAHPGVYIAASLFAVDAGVSLIRTQYVEETILALETHLACTRSARPFRLSRAIVKAIKNRRQLKGSK